MHNPACFSHPPPQTTYHFICNYYRKYLKKIPFLNPHPQDCSFKKISVSEFYQISSQWSQVWIFQTASSRWHLIRSSVPWLLCKRIFRSRDSVIIFGKNFKGSGTFHQQVQQVWSVPSEMLTDTDARSIHFLEAVTWRCANSVTPSLLGQNAAKKRETSYWGQGGRNEYLMLFLLIPVSQRLNCFPSVFQK